MAISQQNKLLLLTDVILGEIMTVDMGSRLGMSDIIYGKSLVNNNNNAFSRIHEIKMNT